LLRGPSAKVAAGIDFGTTNSSFALADSSGSVQLATFPYMGALTDAYRSLLYLERTKSWSGPEGIERYLSADNKGRLVQSLKCFLSSRTLLSTEVFGRRRTLEELISRIVRDLREKAEQQFGVEIRQAVVGRPVRFVGAEDEDQNLHAQGRLGEAFRLAGFDSVEFEMEPVAAAAYYESTLDHDELILIGDFGGGTSDFSLIHVGPGTRSRNLLGNAGVGLAGDAFDAKIIRNLVSPALGAGTQIRSMNKVLPVPTWVYGKLERWHHLSFLKSRDVMNMLNSVLAQADHPDKIAAFIHLIDEDLGYQLHRAVQKTKCDLSIQETARFQFDDGSISLDFPVRRSDFELWISEELAQIEGCIDTLINSCGIQPDEVDMVFLTGGTSFVPAVRRIFESRFGAARIRAGNEFTSVARGLALNAARARLRPSTERPRIN
jgi:hypothetical chaperone protein